MVIDLVVFEVGTGERLSLPRLNIMIGTCTHIARTIDASMNATSVNSPNDIVLNRNLLLRGQVEISMSR